MLDFVPGSFVIEPAQYAGSQVLERQRDSDVPVLLSASDGGPCSSGILGPGCVAYVDPANRDLGPNIDVTDQD
jgi:hypothetical protein